MATAAATAAAAAEEVKLLGAWPSPYVLRARIALNLMGVSYEFLQEDYQNKSELLLKSNPIHKKVPVLIHNGKPICESLVIVEYIDQVWANAAGLSILPSDPYDRAIARFWACYIDDKLTFMLRVLRGLPEESKEEAVEEAAGVLQRLEEAFEKCSKGKNFFGGDNIGYLDIALGSRVGWIKASEKMVGVKLLDERRIPLLVGWIDRFFAADAVKQVTPEVDRLIEFVDVRRAMWNATPTN